LSAKNPLYLKTISEPTLPRIDSPRKSFLKRGWAAMPRPEK